MLRSLRILLIGVSSTFPSALSTCTSPQMSLQLYSASTGEQSNTKRKNVPTGHAEEIVVSDITFNSQHRKYLQRQSKPDAPPPPKRQKGDVSVVSGENAYKGPWAKWDGEDTQFSEEEASLASDEEYVEEGSLPGPSAPMPKASTAYASDDASGENTIFHGSEQFDYQGSKSTLNSLQCMGLNDCRNLHACAARSRH